MSVTCSSTAILADIIASSNAYSGSDLGSGILTDDTQPTSIPPIEYVIAGNNTTLTTSMATGSADVTESGAHIESSSVISNSSATTDVASNAAGPIGAGGVWGSFATAMVLSLLL